MRLALIGFHWLRARYYRMAIDHLCATQPVHPDIHMLCECERQSLTIVARLKQETL